MNNSPTFHFSRKTILCNDTYIQGTKGPLLQMSLEKLLIENKCHAVSLLQNTIEKAMVPKRRIRTSLPLPLHLLMLQDGEKMFRWPIIIILGGRVEIRTTVSTGLTPEGEQS